LSNQEKRFDAPIRVGPSVGQFSPALISVLYFEANSDPTCRCAARSIQDVCGDGAHVPKASGLSQLVASIRSNRDFRKTYVPDRRLNNFPNLIFVIFACSRAAIGSSVSRSFPIRVL